MKGIAVLGSTGSVGRQALEVIRRFPESFAIVGLAGWTNLKLLQEQLDEFQPALVCYRDPAMTSLRLNGATVATMKDIVCHPKVDLVVMATAGSSSLRPTIAALQAGKAVALASKEAIVMGGPIVAELIAGGANLLPVDSEPSAIWQCLQGEPTEIARLIITASGGPFRTRPAKELSGVTPEEALNHPTWTMGKKITIDSATLMNKALEVIESHWLFNVPWKDIEVVVHPQSIVHSFVEFKDGSIKAQMGLPDMRLPLQYALFHPVRRKSAWVERLDLARLGSLHFEPLDAQRYPCFTIALEAAEAGGTYPAVLCAADDVAVGLFLNHKLGFMEIPSLIKSVLDEHVPGNAASIEDVLAAENWARQRAHELSKVFA